VRQSVKTVN